MFIYDSWFIDIWMLIFVCNKRRKFHLVCFTRDLMHKKFWILESLAYSRFLIYVCRWVDVRNKNLRLREDDSIHRSLVKRKGCKQHGTDGLHMANGSRCLRCLLNKPVCNLSIILFTFFHLILFATTISLNYHADRSTINQAYLNQVSINVHLAVIFEPRLEFYMW